MYSLLAPVYRELFPLQQAVLELCLEMVPPGAAVLDLACGDGALVEALCAAGVDAEGVDLDSEMVRSANSRLPGRFSCMDMRSLHGLPSSYRLVCCLGNSLAYLSASEVLDLLQVLGTMTDAQSQLLIQTVNWSRVLTDDFAGFPIRHIKGWGSFEREYRVRAGCVSFVTRVHLESGMVHEFCDTLYALGKNELHDLLNSAGWSVTDTYGSFNCTPWSEGAPATIIRARR